MAKKTTIKEDQLQQQVEHDKRMKFWNDIAEDDPFRGIPRKTGTNAPWSKN